MRIDPGGTTTGHAAVKPLLQGQHDVAGGFFQWGASAFFTDAGLLEEHDDGGGPEFFELGQNTFALDFLYRTVDGSNNTFRSTGVELFFNDRDIFDEDTETIGSGEGVGLSAFYEQGISKNWSLGAQASSRSTLSPAQRAAGLTSPIAGAPRSTCRACGGSS